MEDEIASLEELLLWSQDFRANMERNLSLVYGTPANLTAVEIGVHDFLGGEELVVTSPIEGQTTNDAPPGFIPVHFHSIGPGMRLLIVGFQL